MATMQSRAVRVLSYALAGLAAAFGVVTLAGWDAQRAEELTDWMTLGSYSVLWAATISAAVVYAVYWWMLRDQRKEE
jgi:hypothetical protein